MAVITRRAGAAALVILAGLAPRASAQMVAVEVDVAAGVGTDDVAALATQARVFGSIRPGISFFGEAAWAQRFFKGRATCCSDAFGGAYPYDTQTRVIEAYGDATFSSRGALIALRAGRFRTPFGIYSRSDHAYGGFTRAPLIRYDGYFALSNNFLEHGATLTAGRPELFGEVTVGRPADVGVTRKNTTDVIARVQGYRGAFIIGASHIRTAPYQTGRFVSGRAIFTGVDVRWAANGILMRGEWIHGRPFNTTKTTGGYIDAFIHRRPMGPLTVVLRAERLDYTTQNVIFDTHGHRFTAGGHVRLPAGFALQAAAVRQGGNVAPGARTALDVMLTFSARRD
jgi:hypothetical protein